MKINKILAACLAATIVGGAFTAPVQSVLSTSITASAANGVSGYFTSGFYEGMHYDKYSDHVEITDWSDDVESDLIIPDEIEGIPVTVINISASKPCPLLTSITLPESVTWIKNCSLDNCENLKSITILNPDCDIFALGDLISPDLTVYSYDSSIVKTNAELLGLNFESIGENPYYSIDTYECMTYKNYKDHIEIINCDRTFEGEIIIPEEIEGLPVTSIGYSAFFECEAISISIPDSVTSIGNIAFAGSRFESITIPDSVTAIGELAFQSSEVKSATLPAGLTTIETGLFQYSGLKSLTIPESVTQIKTSAFSECEDLEAIIIPKNVTEIGRWTFNACRSLESITILNPDCAIYDEEKTICTDKNGFNGTIYGYEGSTAQAYAEKYGYSFEAITEAPDLEPTLLGDANCDDNVDMADVVLLMQSLANPNKYGLNGSDENAISEQGMANGDVDKSSAGITANDALRIQEYLLKKINSLETDK